jgi:hypothetical protein
METGDKTQQNELVVGSALIRVFMGFPAIFQSIYLATSCKMQSTLNLLSYLSLKKVLEQLVEPWFFSTVRFLSIAMGGGTTCPEPALTGFLIYEQTRKQ